MDVVEQSIPKKLSHKQYKALLRKEKRQRQRQAAAKLQDELEAKNATPQEEPSLEESKRLAEIELEQERKEVEKRQLAHKEWLEREQQAQEAFDQQRKKEEARKHKLLEEQQRIQQEWEARQEKENHSLNKKERELQDILQQLDKEIATGETRPTHNPEAPRHTQEAKRETCPFFLKTGGCRFGDRCSRAHPQPAISTVLLLPHMYLDFTMEQSHRDEYDTDMGLEYDEGDAYERFLDFYQDVLPEFKAIGTVVQFKVCCNWEPHLRGNVYVQYKEEEDSSKAREIFHCRFYAGKQLSCIYTPVASWKAAICGMFHQNKCSRGKNCNFLHVFQNPKHEFVDADRDFQMLNNRGGQSQRVWRHDRDRSYRDRSRSRERCRDRKHRSHSRDRRHRSVERSRSRYSSRRHRSRSRGRARKKRSRTCSRSQSRSPLRSSRKHRSRSGSRSRRRSSKSPSRCRKRRADQSRHDRSRSRSRSRHRESRSLSQPRSSRSRSPSFRSSRNRRSLSKSRDYLQSSSDSGGDIYSRTKSSPSTFSKKKKHKSAKNKSRLKSPDSSDGDSLNLDKNAITNKECVSPKSGTKVQTQCATNRDQDDKNIIKTLSIDQPKMEIVEDRHQMDVQEGSCRTGQLRSDVESAEEDSEGQSEDDSTCTISLENRYSRASSREKNIQDNGKHHHHRKKKHKDKQKKSHKKRKRASSPIMGRR